MLKEGIFLGKRYEILGRIGTGGMADVYKGKDHKLNRFVAIKVLKSDFRTDEVFVRNFLREAQAAAVLLHPNIVNVYDVGQDRGLYYMVMELVEGITLKEYIEKKGRLSAKETTNIAIQMVTGIQAAHNKHIIHRDIKPQNIIISKDGKVKVTDFGIARATTSTKTISAAVMGSVHYTSPEQAKGGRVDEKSDIYSAGITMYEMITGHVPFDGDSTVSVAIKHLQENIVSPAKEVPDIPYSLECIILKCTQKDPARRYQNAGTLLFDLKRSLLNPDGDFVKIVPAHTGTTAAASAPLKKGAAAGGDGGKGKGKYHSDDYADLDDDDFDDDDDLDDDDFDDGDDDYHRVRDPKRRRKKDDVDTNMKKIMKILTIVVAAIIAFMAIFMAAKALGLFKAEPDKIQDEAEERLIKVPNVVGRSLKDADEALKKKHLGIRVVGRNTSDEFREGIILFQEPGENERVEKNTEIKVVVSLGKEEIKIRVPSLAGEDEADAQRKLNEAKLTVDLKTEFNDTIREGKVIRTEPLAGAEVKEGSRVVIIVSKGPEKVKVPNLIDYKKEDAESILADFQLKLGEVKEEYSKEYAAGVVMDQNPKKDEKVDKDTPVNIVVSKGPELEKSRVPNLIMLTEQAAIDKLLAADLTPDFTYEFDPLFPEGHVKSQDPAAGVEVPKGTFVKYVVSKGKEPEIPPDPPTPPESETPDTPDSGLPRLPFLPPGDNKR